MKRLRKEKRNYHENHEGTRRKIKRVSKKKQTLGERLKVKRCANTIGI